MHRLTNPLMAYAWGSRTAIAALQGRAPSAQPEAELWLGAHEGGPSRLESGEPLGSLIARDPVDALGAQTAQRFDNRLPFLLKVLAAEQPLSLQAHPSLEQARAGFAREEAAGLPRTAPTRSYKDPNHKPELICALTRFTALCGFRALAQTVVLLDALDVPLLRQGVEVLTRDGLGPFFRWAMVLPKHEAMALAQDIARALAAKPLPGFEVERAWGLTLAKLYPSDIGLLGALLLNLVTLEPGEALYLPAGNLHAYLKGVGVEVMASSDNVLRGGLTPKHVDVKELLAVLDFRDGPVRVLKPSGADEAVYTTPAPEFRLSRLDVSRPVTLTRWSADVVLCTEGTISIGSTALRSGESVFIAASEGPVTLTGQGTVFRATVNDSP